MIEAAAGGSQRLDAWLWRARLARTRAACAALIENGRVRINSQPTDKAHARLRPGDVLTIAVGDARGTVRIWHVLALAARRGPPASARALFEDLTPPADGRW